MVIAVDFDGTIVEHKYPRIGKEIPFAIATLKRLQEEGHRIILWTVREGDLLQQAVDFCRERGLEFYAVNANFADEYPEEPGYCRKIKANLLSMIVIWVVCRIGASFTRWYNNTGRSNNIYNTGWKNAGTHRLRFGDD